MSAAVLVFYLLPTEEKDDPWVFLLIKMDSWRASKILTSYSRLSERGIRRRRKFIVRSKSFSSISRDMRPDNLGDADL